MKLTNFKLLETKGKDCSTWKYIAEVDVETRPFPFWKKRVETRKIIREYAEAWNFVDTGKFTPDFQSDRLARLVRLKPQVSEERHGAEPSIRELIFNYYADHDIENPEQLTSYYLSELEKMAG